MKVPVSNEDKQKSYYKFYEMDMAQPPREKMDLIEKGPWDPKDVLRIQDRARLFEPGYHACEFGYWTLEDGTATTACLTDMPGVTAEMFDWWFAWHPLDRLRYAIWDPEDHFDVQLEDHSLSRDKSNTLAERNWGSVHHVWEDIGLGFDLLEIRFHKPSDLGYDMDRIGTDACSTIVCSNAKIYGRDFSPTCPPS